MGLLGGDRDCGVVHADHAGAFGVSTGFDLLVLQELGDGEACVFAQVGNIGSVSGCTSSFSSQPVLFCFFRFDGRFLSFDLSGRSVHLSRHGGIGSNFAEVQLNEDDREFMFLYQALNYSGELLVDSVLGFCVGEDIGERGSGDCLTRSARDCLLDKGFKPRTSGGRADERSCVRESEGHPQSEVEEVAVFGGDVIHGNHFRKGGEGEGFVASGRCVKQGGWSSEGISAGVGPKEPGGLDLYRLGVFGDVGFVEDHEQGEDENADGDAACPEDGCRVAFSPGFDGGGTHGGSF